jgi:hypothetical protein
MDTFEIASRSINILSHINFELEVLGNNLLVALEAIPHIDLSTIIESLLVIHWDVL